MTGECDGFLLSLDQILTSTANHLIIPIRATQVDQPRLSPNLKNKLF